jgi:hypothetical protein
VRKAALAVGMALSCTWALPPAALAWDDFGHMEVGAVAWKRMNANARNEVSRLLRLNPRYSSWIVGAKKADVDRVAFLRAGTWADSIKKDRGYTDDRSGSAPAPRATGYADRGRHRNWHYVDQPFSPDGTPLVAPTAPNAATVIPMLRAELAAASSSDDAKSYALVWLLHVVPDVHQPLHCVSRYDAKTPKGDRGGNLTEISGNVQPAPCDDPQYCPFGPPTDLHAFIDTIAGSGYAWGPPEAAARALPPADPVQAKILDVSAWVAEGLEVSRTAVYVPPVGAGPGPFTITPAYQAAMLELGKRRMALAGARLANLLDATLGK